MKNIIVIIALGAILMLPSCIDEDFDLSNVESGDITIGNDDSEFLMPLANVSMTLDEINQEFGNDVVSITQLHEEVSVWMPSELPSGATYIDVTRLLNDDAYYNEIFEALYSEMLTNEQKRAAVSEYLIEKYREELFDALEDSPYPLIVSIVEMLKPLSDTEAAALLSALFMENSAEIKDIVYDLSYEDVSRLELGDVHADIPALDISDEIKDALSNNIDAADVQNSKNALYIYGTVESDFPCRLLLQPKIENTKIDMGEIAVDRGEVAIDEVRVYKEDLQTIFDGSRLVLSLTIDRYYPYEKFNDDSEITISLSIRKIGGLKM